MGRYKKELTQKIGLWLAIEKPPQKVLAESLEVDPRTLRNWKKKAIDGVSPRIGRPPYSFEQKRTAFIKVARVMIKQGYPGSPTVDASLNGEVPRRLVIEFVAAIKALRKRKKDLQILEGRQSIEVLRKDVIWVQDGTHLGRCKNKAIEAQVIKDRGTLSTINIVVGTAANEDDIIKQLSCMKESRSLPLTWMTDNGSSYVGERVKEFLRKEKVVHLRSMPRVPQHNASAERNMCELKNASMLGKGIVLGSINEGFERLTKAASLININRPRLSKNMKTAKVLEIELPTYHDKIDRDSFYERCMKAIKAVEGCYDKRRAVIKKRDAVFEILSEFELISINRGVR